jgi:hypothetical protein
MAHSPAVKIVSPRRILSESLVVCTSITDLW